MKTAKEASKKIRDLIEQYHDTYEEPLDLKDVSFFKADMRESDFNGADMRDCDLRDANMYGSRK